MQQEALGQLQAGLIGELESQGTFQDPETQRIMDKYQKVHRHSEVELCFNINKIGMYIP